MKRLEALEQGTSEWLDWRRSKITATDSSIITGYNTFPGSSPYNLFLEKKGYGKIREMTEDMLLGKELEPLARVKFMEKVGTFVKPVCVESSEFDWSAASLDGLSADNKTLVEIKVHRPATFQKVKEAGVPTYYFPQLQKQLFVCELDTISYFCINRQTHESHIIQMGRDEGFIKKMIQMELEFLECLETDTPPKECDNDFIEDTSERFNQTASDYLRIKNAIKDLELKKAHLRDELIEMCFDRNTKGSNLKMQKVITRGLVDYKKIPELKGINLDQFRNSSYSKWNILEI